MRLTLRDLAQQTGMSIPTVSQVLSNTGRISQKTRARVLAAASKMGYRPNAAARQMRRGSFGSVGLLFQTAGTHLPLGLIVGIIQELSANDMQLSIADLPDEKLNEPGYAPMLLKELSTDGLLINYILPLPDSTLELLGTHAAPAVWLNNKMETDSVYPDDIAAGRLAAEHLLALGHRRIGFVCFGTELHYSVADRRSGFVDAVRAAGLEPIILERPVSPGHDYYATSIRFQIAREILAMPDRPTAFVAYEDFEALPLVASALSMGLEIPRDVSIVACHESAVCSLGIPVATVRLDWDQVGMEAVRMLLKRIKRPGRSLKAVTVPCGFVEGMTTGPPR